MAYNNTEQKLITITDTRFIFQTNFEGKPDPTYGSTARVANVVIPPSMVKPLEDAGINVRSWPREPEEDQEITYFIKAQATWRYKNGELKDERLWPSIKLYRGRNTAAIELNEETVKTLDEIDIETINIQLSPWENPNGGISLYIRDLSVLMNCHQDPFAGCFGEPADISEEARMDEEEPF